MERITVDTVLRQGDKVFTAVQVKDGIVWISNTKPERMDWFLDMNSKIENPIFQQTMVFSKSYDNCFKIVAANFPIDTVPLVDMEPSGFDDYEYTLYDIKEAIRLAREADSIDGTVDLDVVLSFNADNSDLRCKWNEDEIISKLNTVSYVDVDSEFNVLGFVKEVA